jgi:hypothetical protein
MKDMTYDGLMQHAGILMELSGNVAMFELYIGRELLLEQKVYNLWVEMSELSIILIAG